MSSTDQNNRLRLLLSKLESFHILLKSRKSYQELDTFLLDLKKWFEEIEDISIHENAAIETCRIFFRRIWYPERFETFDKQQYTKVIDGIAALSARTSIENALEIFSDTGFLSPNLINEIDSILEKLNVFKDDENKINEQIFLQLFYSIKCFYECMDHLKEERNIISEDIAVRTNGRMCYRIHIRGVLCILFRTESAYVNCLASLLSSHVKYLVTELIPILEKHDLIKSDSDDGSCFLTAKGKLYSIFIEGFRLRFVISGIDNPGIYDVGTSHAYRLDVLKALDRSLPLKDLIERIEEQAKNLSPPDPHNGQWYFDPLSIIDITIDLLCNHDLEGQVVCCLCTPTLAFSFSKLRLANTILLLDIDSELKKQIEIEENKHGQSSVRYIEYDLQKPVAQIFDQIPDSPVIDSLITDPVYSTEFYQLTFDRIADLFNYKSRGINVQSIDMTKLLPGKAAYIIFPARDIGQATELGMRFPLIDYLMTYLDKNGLSLDSIQRGVIRYITPPFEYASLKTFSNKTSEPWRTSNLMRVVALPRCRPFLGLDQPLKLSSVQNTYRCRRISRSLILLIAEPSELLLQVYDNQDRKAIEYEKLADWDGAKLSHKRMASIVAIHDIGDWNRPCNDLILLTSEQQQSLLIWYKNYCESLYLEIAPISKLMELFKNRIPSSKKIAKEIFSEIKATNRISGDEYKTFISFL